MKTLVRLSWHQEDPRSPLVQSTASRSLSLLLGHAEFHPDTLHARLTVRDAESGEKLLSAAARHPAERTAGSQESARRTPGAAAAASAAAAAGCRAAGARGGARELPLGLHSRGEQHGQLHGAGQELGAVSVSVLCAKAGTRHEAAPTEERVGDLQRRVPCRVSARSWSLLRTGSCENLSCEREQRDSCCVLSLQTFKSGGASSFLTLIPPPPPSLRMEPKWIKAADQRKHPYEERLLWVQG